MLGGHDCGYYGLKDDSSEQVWSIDGKDAFGISEETLPDKTEENWVK